MSGRKTYTIALGVILGTVAALLQGEMTWQQAIGPIITALLAATLRHGIAKETASGDS